MNPDPFALAYYAGLRAHEDQLDAARRSRLHEKAVARRRKAKRGGKG